MSFPEFRLRNKIMRNKVIRKVPVEDRVFKPIFVNWKPAEYSMRRNVKAQFPRFLNYLREEGYNKVYAYLMGNRKILNLSHKDRLGMVQRLSDYC